MATDRIRQLEQFYQEDPGDPFNIYALALEYMHSDRQKTAELFDILLDRHADYLPTYYHAAKFFEDNDERDKAIQIYDRGIALARKVNDAKALRELQAAYDEMMFE